MGEKLLEEHEKTHDGAANSEFNCAYCGKC